MLRGNTSSSGPSSSSSSTSLLDDDDPIPLSWQCERYLQISLEYASADRQIDQESMTRLGASYLTALTESRQTVWSVTEGGARSYTVGICRCLVHRFRLAHYAYARKGFSSMTVLLGATTPLCCRLETQLIADFRDGSGPQRCLNKRKGGDTPPDSPGCFCYVCVK